MYQEFRLLAFASTMNGLMLLAGFLAVASGLQVHPPHHTCLNDGRLEPISKDAVGAQMSHQALFWETAWKMQDTAQDVSEQQLEKCGSCGPKAAGDAVKLLQSTDGSTSSAVKFGYMFSWIPAVKRMLGAKAWRKVTQARTSALKKVYRVAASGENEQSRNERAQHHLLSALKGLEVEHEVVTPASEMEMMAAVSGRHVAEYMTNRFDHSGEKELSDRLRAYTTHQNLLERIHKDNPDGEDLYVVVDDGASLLHNWHVQLLKTIPEDWDLLILGHSDPPRCEDRINEVFEVRAPAWTEEKTGQFYGQIHAYAVRPKSVPRILEQMRSLPVMDIGHALLSLHKEGVKVKDSTEFHWSWGAHVYALHKPVALSTEMAKDMMHEDISKVIHQEAALRKIEEELKVERHGDPARGNEDKIHRRHRQDVAIRKVQDEISKKRWELELKKAMHSHH